jgi:hypothetical protein
LRAPWRDHRPPAMLYATLATASFLKRRFSRRLSLWMVAQTICDKRRHG